MTIPKVIFWNWPVGARSKTKHGQISGQTLESFFSPHLWSFVGWICHYKWEWTKRHSCYWTECKGTGGKLCIDWGLSEADNMGPIFKLLLFTICLMFVIVLAKGSRVERRSLVSIILWFECGMFILHGCRNVGTGRVCNFPIWDYCACLITASDKVRMNISLLLWGMKMSTGAILKYSPSQNAPPTLKRRCEGYNAPPSRSTGFVQLDVHEI